MIRAGIRVSLVPYASRRTYEDKGNDIDPGAGRSDRNRRPGSRTIRHARAAGLFAGFNGNREALERGMKLTEDTLAKDPNHAGARVWHGSGVLYLSGQAFQKGDQQNGMKLWRQGLDEMEQAVRLAPNNVAVLIPRGATLIHILERLCR